GLGAWRVAGGALVLGALAAGVYGRGAIPARADLLRFVVCAWLGVALNQGLFLVGLSRSTPVNAALVMALIPVFTFVIAAALRQEAFSGLRLLGVLIALMGLLPLLFTDGLHSLGRYGVGNLFMVANALSYSFYLVLTKPLTRRYPPIVIIAWSYVFSLVALPVFVPGQRLVPGTMPAWWGIAYIVAFPTIIAYLLNVFALGRVRASTTAVYIYAQPLVTGTAAWFLFGEQPTHAMALAAGALFIGIWLVARRPPPPDVAAIR
ncbi:MAG: DMT family transporter, partial [Gemmatimonadota bacterium]|nr:DMT family transporter [Gemmatimonadota bacterium]